MKVSYIIRVRNEEKWLEACLQAIENQTLKDSEIIIIYDEGSKDNTLKIAKKHDCKIVTIKAGLFTYPYASNLGAKNAKGEFLVYLSGHSVLQSKDGVEKAIENFEDPKVAGVYGPIIALSKNHLTENLFYKIPNLLWPREKRKTKIAKIYMGVMGTTNAILRKDLWLENNFNEKLVEGGEDMAWAKYYINKGYYFVKDPALIVRHSHNLRLLAFLKQYFHWKKIAKPFLDKN